MGWTEKGIGAAAELAGGAVWLGFSAAPYAAAFEPTMLLASGALGLARVVTDGFRKYGVESPQTIDGIRKKARAAAETRIGKLAERLDLQDADKALAQSLKDCFPDRDGLVAAAQDKDGFPTRATMLVLAELAARHPKIFGAERQNDTGILYARTVVHAALEAAVTTPEYFQKLQPRLDLLAHRNLARLLDFNGDTKKWQEEVDAKLDAIQAKLDQLIASGAATNAEATGLSEAQVRGLLTAFEQEGTLDLAESLLLKAAEEFKGLRERLSRLSNEDEPGIAVKLQLAREAIDRAEFARADILLGEAEAADLEAGVRRIRRAAETMAERGALARAQSQYEIAAGHFGRAAAAIAPYDEEASWAWWFAQADTLDDHGRLFPGPSLHRAVEIWRDRCLPHTPRQLRASDWAMTQNNLGIVLSILGERASGEEGLAALNEAVAAYRAALEVRTREGMPADWAMTQNNQGNTLSILGERAGEEEAVAALNEAVVAYRAVLDIYTREEMPTQWAMTQNNLGNALQTLGARAGGEQGRSALNEAVAAYRAVLEVYTRGEMPANWAMTQNNLGSALHALGARAGGDEGLSALNEAVAAHRAVLEVYTRGEMPADWAMTQNNLGAALTTLGERASGEEGLAALNEAVAAYRAALEVRTREDMPAQWATTQYNLGNALSVLGERAGGEEELAALSDALAAYRAALEVRTRKEMPYFWEITTHNLELALATLARLTP